MKKIVLAVMVLALFGAMAHAEDKENPYVKTREQIKKEGEAIDKAYQRTLRATDSTSTAPTKNDPWANMRGGDNSKSK